MAYPLFWQAEHGQDEDLEEIKKSYLEDEALKYHLQPIALGLFGGIMDKNKMDFIFRRTLGFLIKEFEAAGFKETSPGIIDTWDGEEIRKWTKELVQKRYNSSDFRYIDNSMKDNMIY